VAVGIGETTGQDVARDKLMAAVAAALDAAGETGKVDVTNGFRWPIVSHDWISSGETTSDIDPASVGPRVALKETITLHLSIGAWNPGSDEEAELAAFHRAFYLLGLIVKHVRTQDITLDGSVLWCLPGSSSSAGATLPADQGGGRVCEIAATFVCQHRIATA